MIATPIVANSVGLRKREEQLIIGRFVILVGELGRVRVRYLPRVGWVTEGQPEQMTHMQRGVHAVGIAFESVDEGISGVEHAEVVEEDQVAGLLLDLDEGELGRRSEVSQCELLVCGQRWGGRGAGTVGRSGEEGARESDLDFVGTRDFCCCAVRVEGRVDDWFVDDLGFSIGPSGKITRLLD